MFRFLFNLFRQRPVRRQPHMSFLGGRLPIAEDIAEEVHYCVSHRDKDGNVMRFMLRGKMPSVLDQTHVEKKPDIQ
jgi:hypothetical protein